MTSACVPIAALPSCHQEQFQRSISGLSAFTRELGKSVARSATPIGCSSCLLRMFIRMEKRGSEPGGRWKRVNGGTRVGGSVEDQMDSAGGS